MGPTKYKMKRELLQNKEIEGSSSPQIVTVEQEQLDPWTLYLYAMKSPASKEKYVMRLGKFLDFLSLLKEGTLEDKSRVFAEKGRNDNVSRERIRWKKSAEIPIHHTRAQ